MTEINWKQRFEGFLVSFHVMRESVLLARTRPLTRIEQLALVQAFEETYEAAWRVLKDYLESEGIRDVVGAKHTIRLAFSNGLVDNGEVWMDMTRGTNTFESAELVMTAITDTYYPAIEALIEVLTPRYTQRP